MPGMVQFLGLVLIVLSGLRLAWLGTTADGGIRPGTKRVLIGLMVIGAVLFWLGMNGKQLGYSRNLFDS